MTVDGIQYWYPLEGWSAEQVFAYLRRRGVVLPGYYENGCSASVDCWCCTAYNQHHPGALRYMRRVAPREHDIVAEMRIRIQQQIEADVLEQRRLLDQEMRPLPERRASE
jgi:phosphoadenosine phosphosulfate reductase